jgi:hypothetical protein
METNKYLHLFKVLEALRSSDDNKLKSALDDLPTLKNANWNEAEEAMIGLFSFLQTQNETSFAETLSKHNISLAEALIKVSIHIIKRKRTNTRCSTH